MERCRAATILECGIRPNGFVKVSWSATHVETALPENLSVGRRLAVVAKDIKLSHTVFAMPFALLATFMAVGAEGRWPGLPPLALIVLCMVTARTFAMVVNRWADGRLDGENPRTAQRAIPSGQVTALFMFAVAAGSGTVFLVAAAGFWILEDNPWPISVGPAVLGWLVLYSYTKRFTWACHLFLGTALALSPLAATLAINPRAMWSVEPYLLALMVTGWIAGMDVIYAMQDIHHDRQRGIHSLPARLGVRTALVVGAVLHLTAVGMLVLLTLASPMLGTWFAIGTGLVCILLFVEHWLVWRTGTRYITLAFFTLNGCTSLLLGLLGVTDVVQSL